MLHRLTRLSAIALACAPAALFGQSKFEGVLTLQLTSPQGPTEMTYSIKGDQVRMDMSGMGGMSIFMLRDASKNSNMVVIPSQRMYMDMPQVPATAGRSAATDKIASHIKMTGKKDMIAGYECEHVIVSGDDGSQHDVCAAKGLGTFLMPNNPMGGRGRGAASGSPWEALGGDFFPLKVQKVGGDVVFEVTKIEKKSLDASTFAVPDGFTKMDMGMGRMGRPPMGT